MSTMPVFLPRKFEFKTKYIALGERALVEEVVKPEHAAHGKVMRIWLTEPRRKGSPPPKAMFYQFKVAHEMYPKNFVKVVSALPGEGVYRGPVLLSEKIELDALSKRLLRLNESTGYSKEEVVAFFNSRDYRTHEKRVKELAYGLANKMYSEGIDVNKNPLNIWFDTKGNPVFFDIVGIDNRLVSKHATSRRVKTFLERLAENKVK